MKLFGIKCFAMLLGILLTIFLLNGAHSAEELIDLKYKILDKGTILVTGGLMYKDDIILKEKCTIFIEDVVGEFGFLIGKGSVLPSLSDKLPGSPLITVKLESGPTLWFYSFTRKGPGSKFDLIDAINVTWVFTKPDLSFKVGQFTFTAKQQGATLEFTKQGVVLKGFEITTKTNKTN